MINQLSNSRGVNLRCHKFKVTGRCNGNVRGSFFQTVCGGYKLPEEEVKAGTIVPGNEDRHQSEEGSKTSPCPFPPEVLPDLLGSSSTYSRYNYNV